MEERDDRLEAERVEPGDESRIALERRLVELPRPRLDAAPRDREPERVRAERRRRLRVLLVPLPGACGASAHAAAGLPRSLPVGPVAGVVPFDLIVRDGNAEEARAVDERKGGRHGEG